MQRSRPVRTAGFVLIGVAVVAVGLGVFALTSNGSGQPVAGRPPSTTVAPPTTTTTHPRPTTTTHTPPPTTTTFPSGQTTTVAPPPPTTTPANPMQTVGIRVYNNSLIKDLARNAAQEFRNAGFNVVSVGNYPNSDLPNSTVYYDAGVPDEQQVATKLAQDFGMRLSTRSGNLPGVAFQSPGVVVILTMDFHGAK